MAFRIYVLCFYPGTTSMVCRGILCVKYKIQIEKSLFIVEHYIKGTIEKTECRCEDPHSVSKLSFPMNQVI